MKATSKDLLKFAFETMAKLNSNKVSVEEAKAQSNLIKQANNIFRYELDRAIAFQKYEKLELREIEEIK